MFHASGPRLCDYFERLKRLSRDPRLVDGLALTVGYLLPLLWVAS
jgi:hypothetical protein